MEGGTMIRFFDDTHTYLNSDERRYRSVTSVLKSLEPKKDWDEITRKYAKKHSMSVEDVKAMWKRENEISIEKGKKVHLTKEVAMLNKDSHIFMGETLLNVVPNKYDHNAGCKIGNSMKFSDGIYPEVILWADSVQLAGQADLMVISDGKIYIEDYKTNKEIKTEGFKSWDGTVDRLVSPCSHLDNCNFNIYSLQLNMYAYMVKRHNPTLQIGHMKLIHILFENPENPDEITREVIYDVPDLQKECKVIFSMLKDKRL